MNAVFLLIRLRPEDVHVQIVSARNWLPIGVDDDFPFALTWRLVASPI